MKVQILCENLINPDRTVPRKIVLVNEVSDKRLTGSGGFPLLIQIRHHDGLEAGVSGLIGYEQTMFQCIMVTIETSSSIGTVNVDQLGWTNVIT